MHYFLTDLNSQRISLMTYDTEETDVITFAPNLEETLSIDDELDLEETAHGVFLFYY